MERKKMIATAAAVLATVFSGGAAIAANLGILSSRQDPVGEFSPVADAVQIADVAPGDGTTAPTNAPTTVPKADDSTPEHQDEHADDDDHEDEREHEDEHEFEGHDDDD